MEAHHCCGERVKKLLLWMCVDPYIRILLYFTELTSKQPGFGSPLRADSLTVITPARAVASKTRSRLSAAALQLRTRASYCTL